MYKKIVGLNKKTALINEGYRDKLIANGLARRIAHLTPFGKKKRVVSQATREKIRQSRKENRDETKNVTNTCPEQLIHRLVELYKKKGRTPMQREIGFRDALLMTYGSMKEACNVAGIPYRPPGVNTDYSQRTKYTEDFCINYVRDFFDANGRLPRYQDMKKIGKGAVWEKMVRKYNKKKIFRLALAMDGRYRKSSRVRYTKEELLHFLRTFEKIHGRLPSYSDCKRGLLPPLGRYSYNFGSWKNALVQAFG